MNDTVVDTIEYRELKEKAKEFDKLCELSKKISLEDNAFEYNLENLGKDALDIIYNFKNK